MKQKWAKKDFQDTGFRDRFIKLPEIIKEWVASYLDLSKSRILDFGCGEGITALGIALNFHSELVVGVDIMPDVLQCENISKMQLELESLPDRFELHQVEAGQ